MSNLTQELEICAESLQACQAADGGGAERIELCSALGEGGVTPTRGFIRVAVASVKIPVHVLIRPRAGNFLYSEEEFKIMCADVEDACALGAAGIVIGMLTSEGKIDHPHMHQIIRRTQGVSITFHRAFDQLHALPQALEQLLDLGCSRVLTSGGKPTVMEGLPVLQELTRISAGRIRIAAGGGVTLQNASDIARVPGLDLHASLRKKAIATDATTTDPLWVNGSLDGSIDMADVRALRNRMREAHATLMADHTA